MCAGGLSRLGEGLCPESPPGPSPLPSGSGCPDGLARGNPHTSGGGCEEARARLAHALCPDVSRRSISPQLPAPYLRPSPILPCALCALSSELGCAQPSSDVATSQVTALAPHFLVQPHPVVAAPRMGRGPQTGTAPVHPQAPQIPGKMQPPAASVPCVCHPGREGEELLRRQRDTAPVPVPSTGGPGRTCAEQRARGGPQRAPGPAARRPPPPPPPHAGTSHFPE